MTRRVHAAVRLLLRHWHRNDKFRFLVIGGWNTVFGYLSFLVLYWMLHRSVNYLVIAVMSHLIAVVNAFAAHRLLVFLRSGPWLREFVRFNLSQLAVLGAGLAGLWLLVGVGHLDPLIAQFVMMGLTLVFSYVVHRHFTFAGS